MTMNYNFQKDMKAIREILGMTQEEFAEKICFEYATIQSFSVKQRFLEMSWVKICRLLS